MTSKDTFVCQKVVRTVTHGCIAEDDIICGLPKDHTCHNGGIKSSWPSQPKPHDYVPSYAERQATEATLDEEERRIVAGFDHQAVPRSPMFKVTVTDEMVERAMCVWFESKHMSAARVKGAAAWEKMREALEAALNG